MKSWQAMLKVSFRWYRQGIKQDQTAFSQVSLGYPMRKAVCMVRWQRRTRVSWLWLPPEKRSMWGGERRQFASF